jgi:methylmalonyl-CoA/ethylmalonyl-CoA epimerase
MAFSLGPVGQLALGVADVDRSEKFYAEVLGLRKLFRFGNLAFFDLAGVRLMVSSGEGEVRPSGYIYFRVADIVIARRELEKRGLIFSDQIHLIAPMEDHDLWMTFFDDPDGHTFGLMMEAPKGYEPSWVGTGRSTA